MWVWLMSYDLPRRSLLFEKRLHRAVPYGRQRYWLVPLYKPRMLKKV